MALAAVVSLKLPSVPDVAEVPVVSLIVVAGIGSLVTASNI
jgi:hypothetical protein